MFSAIILRSVYNLRVADKGDPVIHAMEQAMAGQKASVLPGLSYIDYIPWIRFWRPFQKKFAMWQGDSKKIRELPFAERNKAFVSGFTRGCISSGLTACADSQRHTL